MSSAPVSCPGRCNHAWRRAETERLNLGALHELTPHWGQPLHCEHCTNRARQQLAELPELVAAIWLEATHGSRGPKVGTIGRSAATHASWPGQSSRLLTDHIVGGLLELEDDIRELRRLRVRPGRGIEGRNVTLSVGFLGVHLEWALAEHPAATETHDRDSANPASQIAGWHRVAQRFTARDPRLEHHRVPCPRCEMLTLFRADGDDYIECRNAACALLLLPSEYLEHTKALAATRQAVAA